MKSPAGDFTVSLHFQVAHPTTHPPHTKTWVKGWWTLPLSGTFVKTCCDWLTRSVCDTFSGSGWMGGRWAQCVAVQEREGCVWHYVTPPFILQRASGQASCHWLHLLHLGCLAFFRSPPKGAVNSMLLAGCQCVSFWASKWEIIRGTDSYQWSCS